MVTADPAAQQRLLDLAAVDTTADQVATRRRQLPEHAEIERLDKLVAALDSDRVRAETLVADIQLEERKAEREVDMVRSREDRDTARLASGQGTPKELEALQHELVSLARRQSELEDVVLEVMERMEQACTTRDRTLAQLADAREELQVTTARRDSLLTDLDRDAGRTTAERAQVAGEIPADLLALYDKIAANIGTGAALLSRGSCQGCRMQLAGSDISKFRSAAPDAVLRCEECGRILVRTSESGL